MSRQRSSGLLLHVTSLPSPFGIGDLGPAAYRFVDLLAETHQRFWQVLPLNPINPAHGNSPYSSVSAFALEPALISPQQLVESGYLSPEDIADHPAFDERRVEYEAASAFKEVLLHRAWERFQSRSDRHAYDQFCREHASWLEPYVLFLTLKNEAGGRVWNTWDKSLCTRDPDALHAARHRHEGQLARERFLQFLAYEQWFNLKRYAAEKGVKIVGDVPIYVNYDSADVWSHRDIFKLDGQFRPIWVAGVPPDYFSKTGQLWGNPVYDWEALQRQDFDWWMRRLSHTLHLFDWVRIDHFRGLIASWEVPFGEKTAINGEWQKAPADAFFSAVRKRFPDLPIIAEDLGVITDDVIEIRDRFGFPGMKLVLFAFGEDNPHHPYLPHNCIPNAVAYTGTHDNNTARGWFEEEADAAAHKRLSRYIGHETSAQTVHRDLARLIMMSSADTVILPVQDMLGLDARSRMNVPSTANGNWTWRALADELTTSAAQWLAEFTVRYGRA